MTGCEEKSSEAALGGLPFRGQRTVWAAGGGGPAMKKIADWLRDVNTHTSYSETCEFASVAAAFKRPHSPSLPSSSSFVQSALTV